MNDPGPMRFVERVGDLHTVSQRLVDAERTSSQTIRKRLALEILHDEERDVLLSADVVKRADVRVIKLGNRSRFLLETLAKLHILRGMRGQDLDCDDAVKPRVARFVDLAHAARADGRPDLVRAQARAALQGHGQKSPDY